MLRPESGNSNPLLRELISTEVKNQNAMISETRFRYLNLYFMILKFSGVFSYYFQYPLRESTDERYKKNQKFNIFSGSVAIFHYSTR
jgi:hypothetical protein